MIKEFQKEYRWLSNFAQATINYNGLVFPSVEHAYMSAKSDDPEWKKKCTDPEITPAAIKKMAKKIKLIEGWDNIKLEVMETCLREKYNQEPYKSKLIDTRNEMIQEGNYWGDSFYGVDLKTGEGKNHLGKLIMKIRSELRSKKD